MCVCMWVLQAAYSSYRYHYGDAEEDVHEWPIPINYTNNYYAIFPAVDVAASLHIGNWLDGVGGG